MMNSTIRSAINAIAKAGMGAAVTLMVIQLSPWSVAIAILCVVLDNQTAPLPGPQSKREIELEFENESLRHEIKLNKLTLETTQMNLAAVVECNNAMKAQFEAWASQGNLQSDILHAVKRS